MKILIITSHMGGGVGNVLCNWMRHVDNNDYKMISLDRINNKAKKEILDYDLNVVEQKRREDTQRDMSQADIVVVNYWKNNAYLLKFLSYKLPPCRMVAWHHMYAEIPQIERDLFNEWIETSPLLGRRSIWSTGDIKPFLDVKPQSHKRFNVGYVGTVDYRKLHADFLDMCNAVDIPNVMFIVVGENNIGGKTDKRFWFTGKVNDVRPFLAVMDIFAYPLRSDHYGTCEQVLGEAMATGLPCVVMDNPTERYICENTGFIANSPENYIKLIETLYNNPVSDGTKSFIRKYGTERYDTHKMISDWNQVFEEMMQKPKRERG